MFHILNLVKILLVNVDVSTVLRASSGAGIGDISTKERE